MSGKTITAIILLLFSVSSTTLLSQQSPALRESFNTGWKFIKYDHSASENVAVREPEGLQIPTLSDASWRAVDVPHDWAIEGPFNDSLENNTGLLPWKGIGWYRKHFTLNENDNGKRVYIEFEGAMAYAKVWLNGKYVGEWPYGYSSFRLDLTPYIQSGKENLLAVRLDTKSWDSRWYPGAGIYRNVWLVKTSQVHVAYNGLYCTTPDIKADRAVLSVEADVENHNPEPVPVTVKAFVYKLDKNQKPSEKPVAESVAATAGIPGNANHRFRLDVNVKGPVLWDIENPELYKVKFIVTRGHNDDSNALMSSIGSTAAYIGMIGSRTKIEKMKRNFIGNGWASPEKWDSLHTPIGLEIGSRTVEEIAVSIAAELVLVRNKPPNPPRGA